MITASDVATALQINPYKSSKSLLNDKCKTLKINTGSFATLHGNKYEDEARELFSYRYNLQTWEIGLVQHKQYDWLGGSPDGIASDGNLIEIKCPLTREIKHEIPNYYYPQVQICMEILNRPYCYFIQYKPPNNFQNGIMDTIKIKRSETWFNENKTHIQSFWNNVLYHRKNGFINWSKVVDCKDIVFPYTLKQHSSSDSESDTDSD